MLDSLQTCNQAKIQAGNFVQIAFARVHRPAFLLFRGGTTSLPLHNFAPNVPHTTSQSSPAPLQDSH
jgi:hypothetical protein